MTTLWGLVEVGEVRVDLLGPGPWRLESSWGKTVNPVGTVISGGFCPDVRAARMFW